MKQLLLPALLLLIGCKSPQVSTAPSQEVEVKKNRTIATSIPALEALCKELLDSTSITVYNPMSSTTTLEEFEDFFDEKEALLDSLAEVIDAVVDIRSIIPQDMLYVELRQRNIRTVHIECATPQSSVLGAIGNITRTDGAINPYIWLAPTNMIRMAEIAATDLMALYPDARHQISLNLANLKKEIIQLKMNYENIYLELPRFDAAQMDESFAYFVKDIDLFIVASYPPEIDWDEALTENYSQAVEQKLFAVVVHRWEPFGTPKEVADKAGIPFAVLTPGLPKGDHFDNGVVAFIENNLQALYISLKASSLNK